jgi:hypothetical protein
MFSRLLAAVGVGSRASAPAAQASTAPVFSCEASATVLDAPPVAAASAAVAKSFISEPASLVAPRAAVRAYFDHMMEYVAGNEVPFRDLMHGYDAMRAEGQRWPKLSAMALSRYLVALGCQRRQVDMRHEDKGRPTLLRFPRAAEEIVNEGGRAAA